MSAPTTRRAGSAAGAPRDPRYVTKTIRRVSVQPKRADIIDGGALLVLAALAFTGFDDTFSGGQYLVVAMAGVVIGGLIAYAAHLLRQPVLVLIVVGVITFFLLGGPVALRGAPGASALPTGGTLQQLARESIHGWKDMLTTLPPVDGTGPMLVLPYLMGLFVGIGGIALATRTTVAFAPVVAPFLGLGAVIILGSHRVPEMTLRAALFAAVALAWGCVRAGRRRPVIQSGAGRLTRLGTAAATLLVAGSAAGLVGPHVPGSGSHERLLLRNHVSPPFNLGDYPSPLGEYQRYVTCDTKSQTRVAGDPLFTIAGSFPSGTVVRFAALDTYNGSVWQASNVAGDRGPTPNTFLKVGSSVDDPATGATASLKISIPRNFSNGYHDYWMPMAGALRGIAFSGPSASADTRDFRYDLATRTGVVPESLGAGDSYTLRVANTVPTTLTQSDTLNSGAIPPAVPGTTLDFVSKAAQSLVGKADASTGLAARVLDIGAKLASSGKLTDCRNDYQYYLAGHSSGRLGEYANGLGGGPPYLGDNEQAAALYALMITSLGVPARVIVGVSDPAVVVPGKTVTAADVSAWVEVEAADGRTWLTIPASRFNPTTRPNNQTQKQPQPKPPVGNVVPPPTQGRPKTNLNDSGVANAAASDKHQVTTSAAWSLPGWVVTMITWIAPSLGIIAVLGALIVGAKAARRQRRRTRGTPAERLAYGWHEVLDRARDLGAPVLAGRTRREQAHELAAIDVAELARHADAAVFGPEEPTDADAGMYWSQVLAARKRMTAGLSRARRARAALSLASLRPLRPLPTGGASGDD